MFLAAPTDVPSNPPTKGSARQRKANLCKGISQGVDDREKGPKSARRRINQKGVR